MIITILCMNKKYTTISIQAQTKADLDEICRKNQTYEQLIQELISIWRKSYE